MTLSKSEIPPRESVSSNLLNTWNYRIVHEGSNWRIAEVQYQDGRPVDYTFLEEVDLVAGWSRQEDLVTTFRLIGFALDRPYLRMVDGQLTECLA